MKKFWQVAWHEYSRHVFRKRFLFALFSVPALLAFTAGVVILVMIMDSSSLPLAYVDQSGLLANPVPAPRVKWPMRTVAMVAYPDEATADADLQAGKIAAYYVLPQDYLQSGQAKIVYLKEPRGIAQEQFTAFLTANLLANQPADIANRIKDGNELIALSADKSREASQSGIVNIILPIIAGILFIVAMSTSSGYLMQAVVEEKENRTMEIMVTSVSPGQLMTGKVIADIAIGFTQLLTWGIFIVLILVVGKNYVPFLSGVKIAGDTLAITLAVMFPAFIMICALMAAVGATITESSEGQQVVGLFTLPIWLPYMLVGVLIQNPNSPLAIALSLFPLTAPMTISMRIGFVSLPAWQVIASVSILVLSAVGAVWLAGRAFRLGMLRYGQRLRWKEIFSRIRV
jgi:ABC-2 type transport system permease protein